MRLSARELEIHDWDTLLLEAGLEPALKQETQLRAVYSALADSWGPELRYLAKSPEEDAATRLYHEMTQVYSWIIEQTI
ncbi:MAG: hypothetical protein AB1705_03025 [Verrucomicrobiota bacterium]